MKFLEYPELGLLASKLSSSTHSVRVMTRIEAYSCKSVASEKKLFKWLDQEFASNLELSRSTSSAESNPGGVFQSAFGPLYKKESRKTFWLMIATLNSAYPDHDFRSVKVENFFREESTRQVLLKMSEALDLDGPGSTFPSSMGALSISPGSLNDRSGESSRSGPSESRVGIHSHLLEVLNPIMDLAHCDVYSYCPDHDSDPHAVDSDDEEDEVASLASSIYGRDKVIEMSTFEEENTMWPMDEVCATAYPGQIESESMSLDQSPVGVSPNDQGPSSLIQGQIVKRASQNLKGRKSTNKLSGEEHGQMRQVPAERTVPELDMVFDLEEDSAGGLLWSSHYFFYNKKMKRILFISSWGRKHLGGPSYSDPAMLRASDQRAIENLLNRNRYAESSTSPSARLSNDRSSTRSKKGFRDGTRSGGADPSNSTATENKRRLSVPQAETFDSSFETDLSEINTDEVEAQSEIRSGDDPSRPSKRIKAGRSKRK